MTAKNKDPNSNILSAVAEHTVRFNECDPLGIVWHGNYIKYFEEGREAFSDKHNFDFVALYNIGISTPIVHVSSDYKKMLQYRDKITIEATMKKTAAAKLVFDYIIRKKDTAELICSGRTIQVFVDRHSQELQLTTPDYIQDWLNKVSKK
jgi:acyl-CoA thioester hydrolase